MITYNRSAFGLNLIFRWHGSAVYRAIVPSLFSVACFFIIRSVYQGTTTSYGEEIGHPYAVGVLVASTTFLIVFRANQGYARYWEAASATHHMMSKWMDATVHSCVFHMQCDHYKKIKPPSYFEYPELNHLYLTRDRERGVEFDDSEYSARIHEQVRLTQDTGASASLRHGSGGPSSRSRQSMKRDRTLKKIRAVAKSINYVEDQKKRQHVSERNAVRSASADDIRDMAGTSEYFDQIRDRESRSSSGIFHGSGKPFPLLGKPRLDGNWGELYEHWENEQMGNTDGSTRNSQPKATFFNLHEPDEVDVSGFASTVGGRSPPLFLQELAHLSSLLVAVALSTLRNDIDGSESPLAYYEPGSPWPEVDPDKDQWLKSGNIRKRLRAIGAFLGMGRSPEEQTRYNAGRPLPVIGGVSEAEIRFLQMAKGPYAKTQLCWNWLSEFCIREHLAGSMGNVGPPIVSRVIQFLGDGMIYYNHARKIMFIPFPFAHAQLSVLFILVMVPCIPFLMDQYTDDGWVGAFLTFFTVLCLSGIHEVARELENPFRNVPNELPLVTFQAQYNEALITMYSGYHPDHYWDGERILRTREGIDSESPQASTEKGAAAPMNGMRHNKAASPDKNTPTEQRSDKEEISVLKQQLASQAKMIEQLATKVNFKPEEALRTVEEIAEEATQQGGTVGNNDTADGSSSAM